MPTKLIDIHPHIISKDTERYPITPMGGKQSVWSRERPVTFEQMIKDMDRVGVDKAAIVHSSTTYGYDNSYLADCVALQPERFTGVFSVDMLADDAPEKIRYWVKRGLSGLRLFTSGSTMQKQAAWLDDPKTFKGWECAGELGIPVCVQLNPEGVEKLKVLIEKFVHVRIIIDHLMKPPIEEGPPYTSSSFLFDLARSENVFLKFSSRITEAFARGKGTAETFLPRLVEAFGASRIAWGSNYPAAEDSLEEIVKQAKTAIGVLPKEDQEWIYYRTAQQLYPSLADK